jgi:hypothetical protein
MATIQYNITIEAESEAKAKEIGNALYTLLMRASNKDDIIFLAKKVNANPKLIQQAKLFLGSK